MRYRWFIANFAEQNSHVSTHAVGIDPFLNPATTTDLASNLEAKMGVAALVGEVGLVGTYRFRPNVIFHAAWDFTWVSGLALAPEQFRFQIDPPNAINTNGTTVYQGLSVTVEITR